MNETKFVLALGVVSGVGMLAWAASGVIAGRILTKSYGMEDGERRYARYVYRDEEPFWFWALCITYGSVGVAVLGFVIALSMR